jgi:sugar lactone lactonase YvrE
LGLSALAIGTTDLAGTAAHAFPAPPDPPGSPAFPVRIPLPNGFQPEGLSIGRGTSFYVGSLDGGRIYRGDLRTGRGQVLVGATAGTGKTGTKVDRHNNRLWAAGAGGGDATVYDADTGAVLAHYRFTDDPSTFVNDLVLTPTAVYFTDSTRPYLYVVPLRGNRLPGQSAVRTLALTGPAADADAFNNGIVATWSGRLLVVQMLAGRLVSVDPLTGASRLVDVGGYSLVNGDGLILRGHTLYVIRNLSNLVAVLRLDSGYRSGTLRREITSPLLRVPATGELFGPYLYVVNGRFDLPAPTPQTDYDVVRLPA